jgi:hypothetical protein
MDVPHIDFSISLKPAVLAGFLSYNMHTFKLNGQNGFPNFASWINFSFYCLSISSEMDAVRCLNNPAV